MTTEATERDPLDRPSLRRCCIWTASDYYERNERLHSSIPKGTVVNCRNQQCGNRIEYTGGGWKNADAKNDGQRKMVMDQTTNNPTLQSEKLKPCPWCRRLPQRYNAPANNPHDPCGGLIKRIRCVTYQCPLNCFEMSPEDWNSRAPVVAPPWKPIATAPRNGAAIIVGREHLVPQSVRWIVSVDKGAPDGAWFVGGYNGTRLSWEPTHWTDLPLFTAPSPASSPVPPEQKVDFSCRVCGVQCDIAPDPPARAVCPEHCEDHDYRYERSERGTYCLHCGQQAPEDWYDD